MIGRRWIQLAAALYPATFRGRYGEEFDALLEDHNPGWREFTDVIRGALKMQMTNATTYLKLAGGLAIAGAIVATAISLTLPGRYVSMAVLRMTPQQTPEHPLSADEQEQTRSRLNEMSQVILSRTSLEGLITQPGLDLYKQERTQKPMEDIVMQMRQRDIRIRVVYPVDARAVGSVFSISFSYPDQQKAQAVVRELVTKFTESNVVVQRAQAHLWQKIWPESAPLPGENLDILDPPSLPVHPFSPKPASYAAWGLLAGLMLGLVAAAAMRHPKWTLQMAGFALGCCALALGVSLLLPKSYTSICVMRMTPAMVPQRPDGSVAGTHPAEKLRQPEQAVLSDSSLAGIITNPSLDLYKKQRADKPIKEIVEIMRRDLTIRSVTPSDAAFSISFTYPDPSKARLVVRTLVSRFSEQNVVAARARLRESNDPKAIEIAEYKAGENLEILDPASNPQEPNTPNHLLIALSGFAAGLLLGAITLHFRRHTHVAPIIAPS